MKEKTAGLSKGAIAFIILWFVFVAALSCVTVWWKTVFSDTDLGLNREIADTGFFTEWQSCIEDGAALNEIAVPGSHDAGSAGMMPLAETQRHSVYEQLCGGARYLDLRVKEHKGEAVISHGPIKGQKLSNVLNDIRTFTEDHPTEFIILDFQKLEDECGSQAMSVVEGGLDMNKALRKSVAPNIRNATMQTVRDNACNYMLLWAEASDTENKDCFYNRNSYIEYAYHEQYHKKADYNELTAHYIEYYEHYAYDRFFVLPSVRTAADFLFDRPMDIELEYKDALNAYIASIADNAELLAKTNIIIRDYLVSDANNVKVILRLNIDKGIVKSDMQAAYTAAVSAN